MSALERLQKRLIYRDKQGNAWPPGGGRGRRWTDADGSELAIITQGDTLDVYLGRDTITNVTLSGRLAARLGWWLVVWWVWSCWAGLKLRIWRWTWRKQYDGWRDEPQTRPTGVVDRATER